MVDIIITSYNRENILKQILNMLSQQNFKDFRVIINDDGSKNLINPNEYSFISRYLWCVDRGFTKIERLQESVNLCQSEDVILLDDDCIPVSNDFVQGHVESLAIQPISRGIILFPDGSNSDAWFSCANIGFKLAVLKKVGFDMRYNFHYGHEDQDMMQELLKAGYTKSAPRDVRTIVNHVGVNYKDNDRSFEVIGHNTNLFISKWGFDPRFKPRPWKDQ